MTESILFQRQGAVARLILNRPEKHNALGTEQLNAMNEYLRMIAEDAELRVLVVIGEGEKTFCAGAALDELSGGGLSDDAFQATCSRLESLRIPTICAANGNVFGGGAELALSCDFRIGVNHTRMRVPAAAIGLCYPAVGIERFVSVLGMQMAKRVLFAAEEFSAEQLLDCGFYDQLVDASELKNVVEGLASQISSLAPLAVQSMKQLVSEAGSMTVDRELAAELVARCLDSDDLKEGFAAKREKRTPVFKGS